MNSADVVVVSFIGVESYGVRKREGTPAVIFTSPEQEAFDERFTIRASYSDFMDTYFFWDLRDRPYKRLLLSRLLLG